MKTIYCALLLSFLTFAHAAPPARRPAAPACDIVAAAHLAKAEAQKIDPRYYCSAAAYLEASLITKPGEARFSSPHWRIIFSLPGDDLTKGTNKDILVLVSGDGKATRIFTTPEEAKYRI